MNYPTLLSSIPLPGDRILKNRIVMPPLVIWKAGEAAEVTDAHLAHYRQTAPGSGLVVVEATAVSPEGRLAATQLGLFADRHIAGMRKLAETIRSAGALPGVQLHHAGARTDTKKTWGATPIDPVSVTEIEIERIIADFGAAARRATEAGFELLEIHGAHGYLGSQFLSPRSNRRTDRWAGSLENRLRFLTEIIRLIRTSLGDRVLVSCRLGIAEGAAPDGAVGAAAGPGLTVAEGVQAALALTDAGLDLIHVSHAGSTPEPIELPGAGSFTPDPVLQLAKPVRRVLSIPVIGVGGIITPEDAEAALTGAYCDLIAAGRAMLADPAWSRKTTGGNASRIERCVQCRPRCHHFREPEKCPARRRLGIGPPGA